MEPDRLPRKLSAILYADVAGYSRLTGADEEGTHRTLRAYLDLVASAIGNHTGRVVHYAGDAVLADFGTVIDALTCAAAIQRDLRSRNSELPEERWVQFRIGVNLGDVIVDQEEIYGDGVNIAARLESLAEPGGICISESVRTAVGNKLELGYEFMGEQSVKNIEQPVRAYRVTLDPGSSIAPAESSSRELSAEQSIAVLPFDNLSADPDQRYFAEAISENITTELSRFTTIRVISRHASSQAKERADTIRHVSEELGVRYLLEGSVQRSGKRVRITAQLIDTSTGDHAWAERFDRDLEDTFAVQDEITQRIASVLGETLWQDSAAKLALKRPENSSADDLVLQALEPLHRGKPDDNLEARKLCLRSLDLEPASCVGHIVLAWTYVLPWVQGWDEQEPEPLRIALEHAQTACSIDPNNAQSFRILGRVKLATGHYEEAMALAERALELNPNDGDIIGHYGYTRLIMGDVGEAISRFRKVLELHAHTPHTNRIFVMLLAFAQFLAREYEAAESTINSFGELPEYGRRVLAACYARTDRLPEAKAQVAALLEFRPGFCLSRFGEAQQLRREEDREQILGALRDAGVPE